MRIRAYDYKRVIKNSWQFRQFLLIILLKSFIIHSEEDSLFVFCSESAFALVGEQQNPTE